MIGLTMRAGKLVIGTEPVCRAMAKGTLSLVIISRSASQATIKKLTVKSEFYGIEYAVLDIPAEELGRIIGKSYAPMTVGVCDAGLAKAILSASSETT
jgi:ribosomal protein L7Ae-like RNA K-turn-binding protein